MNNTRNVRNALDGTKTAENLKRAFEKEAFNYTKNSIFSESARRNGNTSAGKTMTEQADNDRRLAELWLSYLDDIDDTIENLNELSIIKDALSGDFYPIAAEMADDEGFDEIAEKLRLAGSTKQSHSSVLKSEQNKIMHPESDHSDNPETPWVCTACGYIVKGNMPPERCPLCAYPSSYFEKM